ncbi:regulator of chromosome condensation (RCC1) repeat-containing protein [Besnoitia besnoiti]|uniref:Regulator of chromosome condensation (RCC1) repeat-containing protein n=1 Tax=Besnoitia besnoiti TaxID=94643 RepID=A0A2A9MG22_BESBE|nr:regulator of chromosome condensation (RCC1) repeat-containing protein [Besnoitia besnoiti]PFH34330.1 regulator of chromosome condensation (RCC1) repeat-containing protein [Besnoitia besnoiti]
MERRSSASSGSSAPNGASAGLAKEGNSEEERSREEALQEAREEDATAAPRGGDEEDAGGRQEGSSGDEANKDRDLECERQTQEDVPEFAEGEGRGQSDRNREGANAANEKSDPYTKRRGDNQTGEEQREAGEGEGKELAEELEGEEIKEEAREERTGGEPEADKGEGFPADARRYEAEERGEGRGCTGASEGADGDDRANRGEGDPRRRGAHDTQQLTTRRQRARDRCYGSVDIPHLPHTPEEGALLAGVLPRGDDAEEAVLNGSLRRASSCPAALEGRQGRLLLDSSTEEEDSSSDEEAWHSVAPRGEKRSEEEAEEGDDEDGRTQKQGRLRREGEAGEHRGQAVEREAYDENGEEREKVAEPLFSGDEYREEEENEEEGEEEGETIWDLWGGEGPSEEDLHLLELLMGQGLGGAKRSRRKKRHERQRGDGEELSGDEEMEENSTEEGDDDHRKSTSSAWPPSSSCGDDADGIDELLSRAAAGDIQDELFVVKKKTLVLAFGRNSYGQLGFPLRQPSAPVVVELGSLRHQQVFATPPSSPPASASPSRVSAPPRPLGAALRLSSPSSPSLGRAPAVTRVFCGSHHSAALAEGGFVVLWGRNSAGQLGRGGFELEEEDTGRGGEGLEGSEATPALAAAGPRGERLRARFDLAPSQRLPRKPALAQQKQEEAEQGGSAAAAGAREGGATRGGPAPDKVAGRAAEADDGALGSRGETGTEASARGLRRALTGGGKTSAGFRPGDFESEFRRTENGAEIGKLPASSPGSSSRSPSRGRSESPTVVDGERRRPGGERGRALNGEAAADEEGGARGRLAREPPRVSSHADGGEHECEGGSHGAVGQAVRLAKDVCEEGERWTELPFQRNSRQGPRRSLSCSPPVLAASTQNLETDQEEDTLSHSFSASSSSVSFPSASSSSASASSSSASASSASSSSSSYLVPPSTPAPGAASRHAPWYKRLFAKRTASSPPGPRADPPGARDPRRAAAASQDPGSPSAGKAAAAPSQRETLAPTPLSPQHVSSSAAGGRRRTKEACIASLSSSSARSARQMVSKLRRRRPLGLLGRTGPPGEHSIFLCQDGSVWLCGSNVEGQLGLIVKETRRPALFAGRPRRMPLADPYDWPEYRKIAAPIACIAAGYKHSAFIDAKDRLWMWGSNQRGQCGVDPGPDTGFLMLPSRVRFQQKNVTVVQIALGKHHSLCLTDEGQVFVWGRARFGVMGAGRPKDVSTRNWFFSRRQTAEPLCVSTPQPVRALCSVHVTRIASGDSHCAAVGVPRLSHTAYEEICLRQLQEEGDAAFRDYLLAEMKKRSAQPHNSVFSPPQLQKPRASRADAVLSGAVPYFYGPRISAASYSLSRPVDGFLFSSLSRRPPFTHALAAPGGREEPRQDPLPPPWPLAAASSQASRGDARQTARGTRARRRSLLLLMSPAQRYRARLFETKRDSWARGGAETDDELLLSDLERRRLWGFPKGVSEPYGVERGSAAHRGGDQLFLWGRGTEGELGCNVLRNQYSPMELPFVLSSGRPCYIQVHEVALGGDFTLTLAASYSTSFPIHDPVPAPSPREGAAAAGTVLDVYRGKPSVSFSPLSAPVVGDLLARRQTFFASTQGHLSLASSPKGYPVLRESLVNPSARSSRVSIASSSVGGSHLSGGAGHAEDGVPSAGRRDRADEPRVTRVGGGGGGGRRKGEGEGTENLELSDGGGRDGPLGGRGSFGSEEEEGGQASSGAGAGAQGARTGGDSRERGEAEVFAGDHASASGAHAREVMEASATGNLGAASEGEGASQEEDGDDDAFLARVLRRQGPRRSSYSLPVLPIMGERSCAEEPEEARVPSRDDWRLRRTSSSVQLAARGPLPPPLSLPVLSVAPPPSKDGYSRASSLLRPAVTVPRNLGAGEENLSSHASTSWVSVSPKSVSSSSPVASSCAASKRGSFFSRPSIPFLCASSFSYPQSQPVMLHASRPFAGSSSAASHASDASPRSAIWSCGSAVSLAESAGRKEALAALARAADPHLPLQLYVWGSNRGHQLPLEPEEPQPTFIVPHRVNLLSLVEATVLARRTPSLCHAAGDRAPPEAPRLHPRLAGPPRAYRGPGTHGAGVGSATAAEEGEMRLRTAPPEAATGGAPSGGGRGGTSTRRNPPRIRRGHWVQREHQGTESRARAGESRETIDGDRKEIPKRARSPQATQPRRERRRLLRRQRSETKREWILGNRRKKAQAAARVLAASEDAHSSSDRATSSATSSRKGETVKSAGALGLQLPLSSRESAGGGAQGEADSKSPLPPHNPATQAALQNILNRLQLREASVRDSSPTNSDGTNVTSFSNYLSPLSIQQRDTRAWSHDLPRDGGVLDSASCVEQRERALKMQAAARAALAHKLPVSGSSFWGDAALGSLWAIPPMPGGRHAASRRVGAGAVAGVNPLPRRRKVQLARGDVWRAICSVKVKSIAAGQEHSLLVVEVEYLEGHKTRRSHAGRSPKGSSVGSQYPRTPTAKREAN